MEEIIFSSTQKLVKRLVSKVSLWRRGELIERIREDLKKITNDEMLLSFDVKALFPIILPSLRRCAI